MSEKNNQMNSPQEQTNGKDARIHKTLNIIGIVLCVILVPILIVNCTLLVKSFINQDEVPDFGGFLPLIVLTDSMYPDIKSGDLIFCQTLEAKDVKKGDVISFFDPAGNGTAVVTHKVEKVMIDDETGKIYWTTKGINNNTEDKTPVPEENLVGRYTGFLLPAAGHIALFMQTTPGLLVCVGVPIILLVGYDLIRRRKYEEKKTDDMATLMAELEALKAAAAAKAEAQPAQPAEQVAEPIAEQPAEQAAEQAAETVVETVETVAEPANAQDVTDNANGE